MLLFYEDSCGAAMRRLPTVVAGRNGIGETAKSGFLPRFLGVLSTVTGLGWLTFLWPPLGSRAFIGVALFAIVGTFATCGWLFIRGVDDVKWRERAAPAATSIWR